MLAKLYYLGVFLCATLIVWSVNSCTETVYVPNSGVKLQFSNDSILFDTVFVTTGSITKRVKVFNNTNLNIVIKDIFLGGRRFAQKSAYRLNINGLATNEIKDFELAAKDSMYIFAEVKINPNQADLPFLVSDSILIDVGGAALQKIYLDAYGRNANFFNKQVLPCNTTITSEKPTVFLDSVLVPRGCTLRINAGAKLFFHAKASLLVQGTLEILGTENASVSMKNDRLDPPYDYIPGSWAGIHLLSSSQNNVINFAQINNAIVGVRTDSLSVNASPKLSINNSVVENSLAYGLLAFSGSIAAQNLLVADSRQGSFGAALGGSYQFRHCTFVSDKGHQQPAFYANNADFEDGQGGRTPNSLSVLLVNCLIVSALEDNYVVENVGAAPISQEVRYTIVKQQRTTGLPTTNNFYNLSVKFVKPNIGDFRPDSASTACGKATDLSIQFPLLKKDLAGKMRSGTPTPGCFECRN